jgi:predicted nucleic acid-binding protein
MKLIVDANVVFSALLMQGKPLRVFEDNSLLNKYELISPEYLFVEIDEEMSRILTYTKYSREEFDKVFRFIKESIELMPFESFRDKLKEAAKIAPHKEDIPYVALSLKLNCGILSGDKPLKERLPDKVMTPAEALERMTGKRAL